MTGQSVTNLIPTPVVLCCLLVLLLAAPLHVAAESAESARVASEIESLREQAIEINRDLYLLEQELLFPESTRLEVFLAVDRGQFFRIDAARLNINGESVASYLYSERQVTALERGAVQRLFTGNLPQGEHEITVFVQGLGPDQREYKQAATHKLNKADGSVRLQIVVADQSSNYQPALEIRQW